MARYQEAWLNGTALSTVHPAVLIQHIQEAAPKMAQKTAAQAGRPGVWLASNQVERREITVHFAIREALNYPRRVEVCNAVAGWALPGGWLEVSSRPGQRIWATMTAPPAVGKLRDWTADIPVTFTAYFFPYWIDIHPAETTLTAETDETAALGVPGTAETALEAEITPTADTLTAVTLTVDGGAFITLTGLTVAAGNTVRLAYDPRHLLSITAGGTGILSKRTAASADDLTLSPGQHTIRVQTDTACNTRLMARGVWL